MYSVYTCRLKGHKLMPHASQCIFDGKPQLKTQSIYTIYFMWPPAACTSWKWPAIACYPCHRLHIPVPVPKHPKLLTSDNPTQELVCLCQLEAGCKSRVNAVWSSCFCHNVANPIITTIPNRGFLALGIAAIALFGIWHDMNTSTNTYKYNLIQASFNASNCVRTTRSASTISCGRPVRWKEERRSPNHETTQSTSKHVELLVYDYLDR